MLGALAAAGGTIGLGVAGGLLKDWQLNAANRRNATALRQQAGIYNAMAGTYDTLSAGQLRAAGMYSGQAKMSAALGRGNARNLRRATADLDQFEQLALHHAAQEARARIGTGRASFAANGVLVDSGSAAKWEQDEAADAALEQLDIMQQFADQGWQYRTQANRALAEGYAAAAGQAGAAMGAAGEAAGSARQAYATRLQASVALQEARNMRKATWYNTIGGLFGGLGGLFIGKAS